MIYNILASNGNVSIPESALYALLGFGVVFLGISFLVFIVWFVGKALSKAKSGEKARGGNPEPAPSTQARDIVPITEDELDEDYDYEDEDEAEQDSDEAFLNGGDDTESEDTGENDSEDNSDNDNDEENGEE